MCANITDLHELMDVFDATSILTVCSSSISCMCIIIKIDNNELLFFLLFFLEYYIQVHIHQVCQLDILKYGDINTIFTLYLKPFPKF